MYCVCLPVLLFSLIRTCTFKRLSIFFMWLILPVEWNSVPNKFPTPRYNQFKFNCVLKAASLPICSDIRVAQTQSKNSQQVIHPHSQQGQQSRCWLYAGCKNIVASLSSPPRWCGWVTAVIISMNFLLISCLSQIHGWLLWTNNNAVQLIPAGSDDSKPEPF